VRPVEPGLTVGGGLAGDQGADGGPSESFGRDVGDAVAKQDRGGVRVGTAPRVWVIRVDGSSLDEPLLRGVAHELLRNVVGSETASRRDSLRVMICSTALVRVVDDGGAGGLMLLLGVVGIRLVVEKSWV
jgi:hypothetical protein